MRSIHGMMRWVRFGMTFAKPSSDIATFLTMSSLIVPAMTFASTANAVVFQGATPVFTDVDPETLLLCPDRVAKKITDKTRAVLAVDYAGQPCDYDALREISDRHNLILLADETEKIS